MVLKSKSHHPSIAELFILCLLFKEFRGVKCLCRVCKWLPPRNNFLLQPIDKKKKLSNNLGTHFSQIGLLWDLLGDARNSTPPPCGIYIPGLLTFSPAIQRTKYQLMKRRTLITLPV